MALSLAALPKRPDSQDSDSKGPGLPCPRGRRLPSPQTQGFMLPGAEHGLFAPEGRPRRLGTERADRTSETAAARVGGATGFFPAASQNQGWYRYSASEDALGNPGGLGRW